MQAELAIPAKQGACFRVAELDRILAIVLVPNRKEGHLRTWTTQNKNVNITGAGGRPKARHCVAIHLICQKNIFKDKIPWCL
jgi:hypothetical protein